MNCFPVTTRIPMWATLLLAGFLIPATSPVTRAAEERADPPQSLFDVISAGAADVRLIAEDASQGRLLVKNLTQQPLVVRVPDAFAALPDHHPVLAQFGNPGLQPMNLFPGQGQGNNVGVGLGAQAGGTQALGGGNPFGAQNGPMNGPMNGPQPFMNGVMRVPPKATRKLEVTTVCLEHGKPQPTPRVTYRIVPLEPLQLDSRVAAVCRLVATRQIDQKVGQAIAWHFANRLTWEELEGLTARTSRYTGSETMFSTQEISRAKALAHRIEHAQRDADSATAESTLTVSRVPARNGEAAR